MVIGLTRKVPRLDSVQIDIDQSRKAIKTIDATAIASCRLLAEIVKNEFIISRMKPESGRQLCLDHAQIVHGHASFERELEEKCRRKERVR
jgi:hypothetical protein